MCARAQARVYLCVYACVRACVHVCVFIFGHYPMAASLATCHGARVCVCKRENVCVRMCVCV